MVRYIFHHPLSTPTKKKTLSVFFVVEPPWGLRSTEKKKGGSGRVRQRKNHCRQWRMLIANQYSLKYDWASFISELRYRCRHIVAMWDMLHTRRTEPTSEKAIWNQPLHMAIVSNSGHRGMRYSAFLFHSWNARCDRLCFPGQSAANAIIVVACSWGLVHKCNFGATQCWPFICMFLQSCVMAVLE